MIRHVQTLGIRNWYGDDLLELQGEPLKVLDEFFAQYGSYVISGCSVEPHEDGGWMVSPGLVMLEGEDPDCELVKIIAPFEGSEIPVELPAYLVLDCEEVTDKYLDGKDKSVRWVFTAQLERDEPEDKDCIVIEQSGVRRFVDNVQDAQHRFVSDLEKAVWNAKETPEGAQEKADKALQEAKEYTDAELASAKNELDNSLSQLGQKVDDNFQTLSDEIAERFDESKEYTNTLVCETKQVLDKELEDLQKKVDLNYNDLKSDAETKLEQAREYTDQKHEQAVGHTDSEVAKVREDIEDELETLEQKVDKNLQDVLDDADAKLLQAKKYADDQVDKTKEELDGRIDTLEIKVDGNYSALTDNITTLESKVNDNHASLSQDISDSFDQSKSYTDEKVAGAKSELEDKITESGEYAEGQLEALSSEVDLKLTGKVDKINGKGLSTNDYTTVDKARVTSGILTDAKTHSDSNLATAKSYADGVKTSLTTEINKKVDKDGNKVLSTNDYTAADKARVTSGILSDAKTYTDGKVSTLQTTVNTSLNGKVDKVNGKGLSTNDYTAADKTRVTSGILTDAKSHSDSNLATAKSYADGVKTSLTTEINKKVDKDGNKVLSTNDYTAADKARVTSGILSDAKTYTDGKVSTLQTTVNTSLNGKVDKVSGKGLSTNDYTNEEKAKVAALTGSNDGGYDYIVDTDAKLTSLHNNTNVKRVLIKAGTYNLAQALNLPANIVRITGDGTVSILLTYKGTAGGNIFNAQGTGLVIENINVAIKEITANCQVINKAFMVLNSKIEVGKECTGRQVVGFDNCDNLISCTFSFSSSDPYYKNSTLIGFRSSYNLSKCLSSYFCQGAEGCTLRGFVSCTTLTSCEFKGWSNGDETIKYYGFYECQGLDFCTSSCSIAQEGINYQNCRDLRLCRANGVGQDIGFYSCSYVYGCTCMRPSGVGFDRCRGVSYCQTNGSSYSTSYYSLSGSSTYACANTLNGGWNHTAIVVA